MSVLSFSLAQLVICGEFFIVKFYFGVVRRGAHLAAERSPSGAMAVERGAAQRCQMARAWPRAAQR